MSLNASLNGLSPVSSSGSSRVSRRPPAMALAAAAVSWWARWQPAMIHAALRAGVDLADISAATGLDNDEVVRRWHQWADVQTSIVVAGHQLLDPDEVRAIRVRIAAEVDL